MLLLSHGFDLYDTSQLSAKLDQAFRLFFVLGLVAWLWRLSITLSLAFCPAGGLHFSGIGILTFALFWLASGVLLDRAASHISGSGFTSWERETGRSGWFEGLRQRSELGIEVVGWTGNFEGELDARDRWRTSG